MVVDERPRSSTALRDAAEGKRKTHPQDVRALIPASGLKDYWYPAIEDHKVRGKPVGLKICGEQIVFFRAKDGVKALHNVCAHRGGSLMHGDCHYEGTISCPYHGWTYDGDGNVLAVLPEGPDSQVPGKVKQRAYPTRTLRGMVFIWMGDNDPAPIEEDVPPEFFHDKGQLLYAWEVWPVNWRAAVENAGDAHVPYVHRDAALVLLNPMTLMGPRNPRTQIINNRAATFGGRRPQPQALAGDGNGARKAEPDSGYRRPTYYRAYFPALDAKWPKHWWRGVWSWASNWAGKKRYGKKTPTDLSEEWGGMQHHLPAMVRLDYYTHVYTRANIPIDEANTRQIYFHYSKHGGFLARWYEKLLFHGWHRWAMYSNFSVQDFRAAGPQRYDTPENLSSTDSHLIMWRRLLTKARGMGELPSETHEATSAEAFSQARQAELGSTPEDWKSFTSR